MTQRPCPWSPCSHLFQHMQHLPRLARESPPWKRPGTPICDVGVACPSCAWLAASALRGATGFCFHSLPCVWGAQGLDLCPAGLWSRGLSARLPCLVLWPGWVPSVRRLGVTRVLTVIFASLLRVSVDLGPMAVPGRLLRRLFLSGASSSCPVLTLGPGPGLGVRGCLNALRNGHCGSQSRVAERGPPASLSGLHGLEWRPALSPTPPRLPLSWLSCLQTPPQRALAWCS